MAKFKPSRGKKTKTSSLRGAIPCGILLISGSALLFLLFYGMMKTAGP